MTQRRHVDDLFTAALDDELSPIDDARFYAHIQSCKDCAAAYAEFTATVEALRELPKARMARVVHLPSTAPVAEESARRRISIGWLNPGGLLRRFPATALAGAVAVVLIIVALAHGAGNTGTSTGQTAANGDQGGAAPAIAPGSVTQEAACASQVTAVVNSSPPATYSEPQVVSAPSLPGARLVLSASALSATAGQKVNLFAEFSLPQVSVGVPGSTNLTTATHSLRPCVTVTVGDTSAQLSVTGPSGGYGSSTGGGADVPSPESPAPGGSLAGSVGGTPIFSFTVPPGTVPGTVLRVVASVPAGFEGFGSPALTATITITTR
ncbi:MAG: zf-HC2 domain-containing protein [Candidatus Dormiibacterota bacterium]